MEIQREVFWIIMGGAGFVIAVLGALICVLTVALLRERKAVDRRNRDLDFTFMATAQRRPPESAAAAQAIVAQVENEAREKDEEEESDVDVVEELRRDGSMSAEASRALDEAEARSAVGD